MEGSAANDLTGLVATAGGNGGVLLRANAAQLTALAEVLDGGTDCVVPLQPAPAPTPGYPHALRRVHVADGDERLLVIHSGDTLAFNGDQTARRLLAVNLRNLVAGRIRAGEGVSKMLSLSYFPHHPLLANGSDEVEIMLIPGASGVDLHEV